MMTRRALLAGLFITPVAMAEGWDFLFDGPRINGRCDLGALRPGDRFRDPRDRQRVEWVITDSPVILRDRTPEERAAGENWPKPIGRKAVNLNTGELGVWPWDAKVIRTK